MGDGNISGTRGSREHRGENKHELARSEACRWLRVAPPNATVSFESRRGGAVSAQSHVWSYHGSKPSREVDMRSCPRRTCKFYFKNVVKCARFTVAVSEADFWPPCLHIFFSLFPTESRWPFQYFDFVFSFFLPSFQFHRKYAGGVESAVT